MAGSHIGLVPSNLMLYILRRTSGISQQQQQEQQQQQGEDLLSWGRTREQQHLRGIFTRVSHSWRLAALSTALHVEFRDLVSIDELSSWLHHNGRQLQPLSLLFHVPGGLLISLPGPTQPTAVVSLHYQSNPYQSRVRILSGPCFEGVCHKLIE